MVVGMQDRVVLVTGGAQGLGLAHVRALGKAGALVVLNDVARGEDSGGPEAAVDSLRADGITAVPSTADISTHDGARDAVETALSHYGRLDALVANAGILRDRSVKKMSFQDVDEVLGVHLAGSLYCALAAWPALAESGEGRIVFTSSASGLYGNFGQANYSAAKAGILGLTKTLAIEGERSGIHVNAIAPVARTQMTEALLPAEALVGLAPERVSPLVAFLGSPECKSSGLILQVGAGLVTRVQVVESEALRLPEDGGADALSDVGQVVAALEELPSGESFASSSAALERVIDEAMRVSGWGNGLQDPRTE